MRKKIIAASIALAVAGLSPAAAQTEWPAKPITITIAYAPGGTIDVVARLVGEILSQKVGQPVVIESRPGGGGAVATTALMKEDPDGYNLVATTSTTVTLDPQVNKLAFGIADFSYVATVGEFPEAIIGPPKSGWASLKEALAAGKEKGNIKYGSSTPLDKLVALFIAKQSGVKIDAVPFSGGAEVVKNVMGGHVEIGYSSGAYFPHAKAGDLGVLAVLGDKRLESFPDTPTLRELGYDLSSVNHILFLAPKGVPDEVMAKMTAAFKEAGTDPKILDLMAKRSLNPVVLTGADASDAMSRQAEAYGALLRVTQEQ
ncbi:MAG: Bug family tripartite tricarboxylate transporter substrate binding protein [Parvibaculaceae bacterium]